MRKQTLKRVISAAAATAVATGMLTGCGSSSSSGESTASAQDSTAAETAAADTTSSDELTEGEKKYPEFITVDVYDDQANFQGTQSGWFAKIVKEKFNMELNIIAPNVAGGGDTIYQTRSANGNLGDLIFARADQGKLADMVSAGLILDLSPYLDGEPNLSKYADAIDAVSALADQDGKWAIPSQVSQASAVVDPGEATDPTNAACVRFDVYQEIGAPEIDTLEDLLPVLQKMQEAEPTSDSGKQVYAFSLFKDWDGTLMQNAGAIPALYGYDTSTGFALLNVENGDIQSVIDDDSMYVRGLKFFFDANQMGLVDPESTTQNFDTVSSKYTDGQVLYSLWPWLGMGKYNTTDHVNAGKGFEVIGINDAKYLCWANTPNGSTSFCAMIGSQAQDPQRMADFLDWMYSPEGIECNGVRGPQGLTWDVTDGQPALTDFGKQAFIDGNTDLQVPDEWGGGTWADGISRINYSAVSIRDTDENGYYYNYKLWDSYLDETATTLSTSWSEWSGAKTGLEYVENNDMYSVVPGSTWSMPSYDTEISTIAEQCKQTIVEYSWQMVFAEDEDEFNSLLKEMQDTAIGLGYEDVYKVDEQNAKDRYALFEQTREEAE